jgi:ribosomal protein S18 acetylase RimI-like enzyme
VRDLGAVADLLERVFSRELDANGRRMIQEARMMGRAGPFMYLLVPLSGGGVGFSPGYVWEENGRIVGNVTMIRSAKQKGVWQLANVAVDPDYRRQGIASRMMAESIAYIRRHKGHTIGLQVRQENKAIALYDQFGFQSQGAVTRWRLSGRLTLDRILSHGRQVIRARRQDWAEIWQIFSSLSPAAQGWPEPLTERDFRPSFWRWLSDFPVVRSVKRCVAPRAL